MLALGAGCVRDPPHGHEGTGGSSQSGGTGGGLGLSDTGGATGTGGQGTLAAAEAIWAAAKPTCPIYRYQSRVSSVFGSYTITSYELANDRLIRSAPRT
jgi:hypothetical protein